MFQTWKLLEGWELPDESMGGSRYGILLPHGASWPYGRARTCACTRTLLWQALKNMKSRHAAQLLRPTSGSCC
jgi:hypothetical protein